MFRAFVKPQPVTTSTRAETVRRPQKGAWRRFIPYVIAAALVAAIVYGFLPKPVEVETAAVSVGPLTVSVLEEGKTRIRHRYVVSAPVTGFLQRVELRASAAIEMGKTVLAVIQPQPASFLDPRSQAETEARLKAAEAGVMQAQAEFERAQEALSMADVRIDRKRKFLATVFLRALGIKTDAEILKTFYRWDRIQVRRGQALLEVLREPARHEAQQERLRGQGRLRPARGAAARGQEDHRQRHPAAEGGGGRGHRGDGGSTSKAPLPSPTSSIRGRGRSSWRPTRP